LDARYQSSSYIDFANSEKLDDYLLLNAQLSYIIKGWEFRFMVNNLLNTDYYNQGYVDFDGIPKYFVTAPVNFYGMVLFSF
jgi:iron complex outermembrane receptor protein